MQISRKYSILLLIVLITPAVVITPSEAQMAQQASSPSSAKGAAPDINVEPGQSGLSAIAVNPNTNKVYVANKNSDTVSVIDGKTDKVLENGTAALGHNNTPSHEYNIYSQ